MPRRSKKPSKMSAAKSASSDRLFSDSLGLIASRALARQPSLPRCSGRLQSGAGFFCLPMAMAMAMAMANLRESHKKKPRQRQGFELERFGESVLVSTPEERSHSSHLNKLMEEAAPMASPWGGMATGTTHPPGKLTPPWNRGELAWAQGGVAERPSAS